MQMENNNQQIPGINLREGDQGETQRTKFLKFQRRGLHLFTVISGKQPLVFQTIK